MMLKARKNSLTIFSTSSEEDGTVCSGASWKQMAIFGMGNDQSSMSMSLDSVESSVKQRPGHWCRVYPTVNMPRVNENLNHDALL